MSSKQNPKSKKYKEATRIDTLGPRGIKEIYQGIDESIEKSEAKNNLRIFENYFKELATAMKESLVEAKRKAKEVVASLTIYGKDGEIIEQVKAPGGRSERKTIRQE